MSSLTPKTHLFHVLFLPLLPYMFDFWAKTSPNGSHQRYLGAPEAFTMCSGYIWLWWKDLNVNHFPKIGNISCQKLFKLFQKLKADGCGMRHIGASDHWRVHAGNGGRDGGRRGGEDECGGGICVSSEEVPKLHNNAPFAAPPPPPSARALSRFYPMTSVHNKPFSSLTFFLLLNFRVFVRQHYAVTAWVLVADSELCFAKQIQSELLHSAATSGLISMQRIFNQIFTGYWIRSWTRSWTRCKQFKSIWFHSWATSTATFIMCFD